MITSIKSRSNTEATRAFILFTAPLTVGLLVFIIIPIIWGFVLSLNNTQGTMRARNFVGFGNYINLFRDIAFLDSLKTITLYGLFIVPCTMALALLLAYFVQGLHKGRGFFRTVFFIPMGCSYVVASMIWRMSLFNGLRFGLVNSFIRLLGGSSVLWINSSPEVWLPLITVRLWLQVGLYMIIYIAGMEEIPEELYEAARVDGAERDWVLFKKITFPLLHNTHLFVLFMTVIHAFIAFDEFYNILGGTGASNNFALARTPMLYLYTTGFAAMDYGKSCAGAFIVTLGILIVSAAQYQFFGLGRKRGE